MSDAGSRQEFFGQERWLISLFVRAPLSDGLSALQALGHFPVAQWHLVRGRPAEYMIKMDYLPEVGRVVHKVRPTSLKWLYILCCCSHVAYHASIICRGSRSSIEISSGTPRCSMRSQGVLYRVLAAF